MQMFWLIQSQVTNSTWLDSFSSTPTVQLVISTISKTCHNHACLKTSTQNSSKTESPMAAAQPPLAYKLTGFVEWKSKQIFFFFSVSVTVTQILYMPVLNGFKSSGSTILYRYDLPDCRRTPFLCGVLFTPFFCLTFFVIMHSRRSSTAM